jgi:signal transduction histidine kinase
MRATVSCPYHGLVRSLLRSVVRSWLAEPRVPGAPARVWRDWALLGVLVPTAFAEAIFRTDLAWPWASLALALATMPTLMWRRARPLAVTVLSFGATIGLSIAQLSHDLDELPGLYVMGALLLNLYALIRWASGRDIAVGSVVVLAAATFSVAADYNGIGEAIGGYAVLGITVAIGLAIRFRGRAHQRELEHVRSSERERLARDLHDTVAHHVSAIAIRAQAGIAVAPTRPDAAVDALRVIEAEASRTLAEMRAMVGVLRRDEPAELAPTPKLVDLDRLAADTSTAAGPPVRVQLGGDLTALPPAVEAAVFRLVQESVTNARRHARRATSITVSVDGGPDAIELSVTDDGEPVAGRPVGGGYGIVGMVERADLLGGTCEAGPGLGRGWVVHARLPRQAVSA